MVDPNILGPGYAPRRPGNRVVVLGASIENLNSFIVKDGNGFTTNISFGKDWPTYAMLLSGGKYDLIRNAAIGGQTTQQFIDRFDTDVTPYRPHLVCLGSVENDLQLGRGLLLHKVNIRALTEKCRAIGALPVWRSAMPHFATGVHTQTAVYNQWLRKYCADEGLPFIDFWSVLVDPTTGMYKVGLTAEPGAGIHPNEAGSKLLAAYWLSEMTGMLPPNRIMMPTPATDTGQLLPTPLFATNSGGTPTTWNAIGGSPSGVTRSIVADPNGYGNLARIASVSSVSTVSLQNNSTIIALGGAANVGDVLEVSGVLTSDGGVAASVIVTINTDGTTPSLSRVPVSAITAVLDHGTYKMTLPALPPGFKTLQVSLQSGPGTGILDFGYPVLRNLTREGAFPV